jgi:hypothetical protein
MKRRMFAASLALAVVSVVGLAGSAQAGEYVPFKGKLEGDVTRTVVPPVALVDIDANGRATHLGRFELQIPHVVDLATRTATGTYEFVAANGDTLIAEFTGIAMPTATPGVLVIVETATITGGTGRFAGASGGFVCEREFDAIAGTTTGYFEGTISHGQGD